MAIRFLFFFVSVSIISQEIKMPNNMGEEFVFFKTHDNKISFLKHNIHYVYEKNKWIKNTLEYNSSYRDSSIIFFNKGKMVEHLVKKEFFSNSKSNEVQNYLNGIL